jgi:hypothetical protein
MAAKPDLSEFARLSKPRSGMCTVGAALGALDEPERKQLEAALGASNRVITAKAICTWLERRGHTDVKYGFVNSHRGQKCSCYAD